MPEYRLEWQEAKIIQGVKIVINCARVITINKKEPQPDGKAEEEARNIFKELPCFSATLKKIVVLFQFIGFFTLIYDEIIYCIVGTLRGTQQNPLVLFLIQF